MSLHATYDCEADALYVRLGDGTRTASRTRSVAPGLQLDFDAHGRLIGLELLGASTLLHADALTNLESADEWLTLIDAASYADRSPSTLRVLLHTGKLAGRKVGRDWLVARHVLDTYAEAVRQREAHRRRDPAAKATSARPRRSVTASKL
jgi:uncharacterized protein YuzE